MKKSNSLESRLSSVIQKAAALRERGCLDKALELLHGALKEARGLSDRRMILLKHLLADCLLDKKNYRAAIRTYQDVLSLVEDPVAYANRGWAYWSLGLFKKALEDYSRAVVL